MASTMVIKVKYGDTLRRFNAKVNEDDELELDMAGLRSKVASLFSFNLDADMVMTYVDEDGDIVSLVDDDDLRDAMGQKLKFLRINVHLNNDKASRSNARPSGSSTPLRSPHTRHPLANTSNDVAEKLKNLPEPLGAALLKLSLDGASKVASVSPVASELVEFFSKMGQCFLTPDSASPSVGEASTHSEAAEIPKVPFAAEKPHFSKSCSSPNNHQAHFSFVDLNKHPADCNASEATYVKCTSAAVGADDDKKKKKVNSDEAKPVASSSHVPKKHVTSSSSVTGSQSSHYVNPVYGCPFSGAPVADIAAFRPCHSFKRNHAETMSGGIYHRGIRCDGCGVHPITGTRYKSQVKEDYDLCSNCFSEMGKEADYVRIDHPVSFRHPRLFKGPLGPSVNLPKTVGRASILRGCKPITRPIKSDRRLDSRFVLDVNVADGTLMAPYTPFTKIWRMQNNGGAVWPQGTHLVCVGGELIAVSTKVELEIPADGVPVNNELDIAADFTAPKMPGRYISYWMLASPTGQKFGQRVWVLIEVDDSLKDSLSSSLQSVASDQPPSISGDRGSQPVKFDLNTDAEPDLLRRWSTSFTGGVSVPVEVSAPVEANPVFGWNFKDELENNFPINDSLLVVDQGVTISPTNEAESSVSHLYVDMRDDATAPALEPATFTTEVVPSMSYPNVDLREDVTAPALEPATPTTEVVPSVSYPIVDLREDATAPTSTTAPVLPPLPEIVVSAPSSSLSLVNPTAAIQMSSSSNNATLEENLLIELQEMGFRQTELNKEILRMNKYDLEKSLDDLCGVAEWDPILEELTEMGFCDTETNRKLLVKNNGSIKRVVMDLVNGEGA